MKIGIGMPIPDLSNLPGSSRPGGGGTPVPPGPPALAQVDNVYSMEFDGGNNYIDIGNVTDLNNQSAFSTSAWINHSSSFSGNGPIYLSGGISLSNRFFIQLRSATLLRVVVKVKKVVLRLKVVKVLIEKQDLILKHHNQEEVQEKDLFVLET